MVCANPTLGLRHAPEAPAVLVSAIKFQTTPSTARRPCFVGARRAVLTMRMTKTNIKVHITSILKALPTETLGLRITCSTSGIEPFT
jgi:hypothetical protein